MPPSSQARRTAPPDPVRTPPTPNRGGGADPFTLEEGLPAPRVA
eukprot:CAMPEP_0182911658 /NCGR_PEP_ID=MMETSP0034_2-20130328/37066_1 /TAXON_ID=156128 /ORGANISM="Nephroselmis pyriformis, Strain CCMP717" /LENGTH=43 /DNA_ID= /DNA_START= /DNA_END= /DNA_ORIENTATION=